MDEVILDDIAFQVDFDLLTEKLHIDAGSSDGDDLKRLAGEAEAIARPKVLYRVAPVESGGDDSVVVDGITLTSRVLRVNLGEAHRIFAYVCTCGTELENWSNSIDDMLYRYWSNTIREMALRSATRALSEDLAERFRPGRTSAMSPGSLGDWPIREQRPLFSILGDPEARIGVRLTDSLLMIPTKSVSGLRFSTDEPFESCQLCPMQDCPGRRAPYDRGLYDEKYRHNA